VNKYLITTKLITLTEKTKMGVGGDVLTELVKDIL
jgi:hypothetical protein